MSGDIHSPAAYAQGKMLDHSAWDGGLVRRITPSDIDMAVDANGKILFCELSSSVSHWLQADTGQLVLYQNAIKGGCHCACLCRHNVGIDRKINTKNDVQSFHVMLWDYDFVCSDIFPGSMWSGFVRYWVNDPHGPLTIRRKLLGFAVGLVKAQELPPPDSPPSVHFQKQSDLFGAA
jgi:hypothetical protein